MRSRRLALLCSAGLALSAAVASAGSNLTRGCVDGFDAAADYFPEQASVEDATGFAVSYHGSYKVVRVREAYAGGPAETYVLVQCGAPAPRLNGDLAGAQVVTVPVASLFSASTTHLPMLADLGRLDVLTGVSRLADLVGEQVAAHARDRGAREFARAGVVDAEMVVSAQPGLFMTGGAFSASLAVIRSAGIPVVANIEWLEPDALGRAEWIKYIALFLNEEARAEASYAAMKARYRTLSARAASVPDSARPLVMTGRSSRGRFAAAGGRSYVAALIRDAGGRYVWADEGSVGAMAVDLEAQVRRAADADIWINGGGWTDVQSMLADEPRYAEFKAFRSGQVWVYDRPTASGAPNDYWSRSVSRPDLVLADLIALFHPSLLPRHRFEWYVRLPPR